MAAVVAAAAEWWGGIKAIWQMLNIWSVQQNMRIHLQQIKTNGVTG